MRLLADENFPGPAIKALRQAKYDLVSVSEISVGMVDAEVFRWAVREDRVILTLDKGFGELSRRMNASVRCGIVLFREPIPPKSSIGEFVVRVLGSETGWLGHFSVVEGDRVRRRPLLLEG